MSSSVRTPVPGILDATGARGLPEVSPGHEPTILIRGGRIVTASEDYVADILVRGEHIELIGIDLAYPADRIIDAAGLLVIPGGVDSHVHLQYPQGAARIWSSDDWQTGTIAAAFGGTTTVMDFVEAAPGQTWMEAFHLRKAEAEARACIDFGFHMTCNRADPASLAEIPQVVAAGMSSFKIYMAYDGIRLAERPMLEALHALASCGALPIVHAEDHEVILDALARQTAGGRGEPALHPLTRPAAGEADATHRALSFAEVAGTPMHIVHVSAARGLEVIRRFRERGLAVTAEVATQHLLLTEERYLESGTGGAKYIMAPPLRTAADTTALWEGLRDGSLDFVITDHCPFTMAQRCGSRRSPEFRRLPWSTVETPAEEPWSVQIPPFNRMPGGAPGIETRLPLLYHFGVGTGRITLNRFVETSSTAAARLFGLYPRKGTIAPGSDADIVLFDPDKKTTIRATDLHQNCDYTPYEGMELRGWPRTVIARGRILVNDGAWTQPADAAPGGRYAAMPGSQARRPEAV